MLITSSGAESSSIKLTSSSEFKSQIRKVQSSAHDAIVSEKVQVAREPFAARCRATDPLTPADRAGDDDGPARETKAAQAKHDLP